MMMKQMKLQIKILLPIILLITISFSGLGVLISVQVERMMINLMETNGINHAESVGGEVELWLESKMIEIQNYSRNPIIQSMEWENQQHYLELEWEARVEDYENILVINKDGNFNSAAGMSANVSDREYFQLSLLGEDVITSPVISRSGNQVVIISTPIYNNNEIVGVMAAAVLLDRMNELVINNRLSPSGYAFLLDDAGLAIAHINPDLLMTNILEHENSEIVKAGAKMLKNDNGVEYYLHIITAYTTIPSTGWKVGIAGVADEFFQPIKDLQRIIIIAFSIIIMTLAVVIFFILYKLIKRITKLSRNLKEKAELKFYKVDTTDLKDEIGDLQNDLSTMTDKVALFAGRLTHTNQEVAANSQELSASMEEVLATNNEIAQAVGDMARSLNSQAGDIEDITNAGNNILKKVNDSSNSLTQLLSDMLTTTTQANHMVEKTQELLETINQSAQGAMAITKMIDENYTNSKIIQKLTKQVDKIAEQTKLLSLNASIESAKAGQYGAGFSVIAEQITKLAQESSELNDTIQAQADTLVEQSHAAKETMEQVGVTVKKQTEMTEESTIGIQKMGETMNSTYKVLEGIVAANTAIVNLQDQINVSLSNLSAISEENTAATEQTSASTEEMNASFLQVSEAAVSLAKLAEEGMTQINQFKFEEN